MIRLKRCHDLAASSCIVHIYTFEDWHYRHPISGTVAVFLGTFYAVTFLCSLTRSLRKWIFKIAGTSFGRAFIPTTILDSGAIFGFSMKHQLSPLQVKWLVSSFRSEKIKKCTGRLRRESAADFYQPLVNCPLRQIPFHPKYTHSLKILQSTLGTSILFKSESEAPSALKYIIKDSPRSLAICGLHKNLTPWQCWFLLLLQFPNTPRGTNLQTWW